jgi:GH15 family glucan-1,4-alpha-glucosidase
MTELFKGSIDIILQNQTPSGAYLASPNFPTYHYCWFRDGAFIAYAMNLAGQHDSAARFHQWAAMAINSRADVVGRAVAKAKHGEPLTGADYLHTRYLPDGQEAGGEEWPNFQLDGFGTWLWALREHERLRHTPLPRQWLEAANLVAGYLAALWPRPCYDCWEEFPDRVHAYTLAAIYGGLRAHEHWDETAHRATPAAIVGYLRDHAATDQHFVKFVGSTEVDASLLGLAVPYRVVTPDDPLMQATIRRIESTLRQSGGLHRYAADTYYGGGEWILLTAWLGWYYTLVGEHEKAESARRWIEAHSDAHGWLPEQIPDTLNDPNFYGPWRERWGEIASPLLWSHAMYIILCTCLHDRR